MKTIEGAIGQAIQKFLAKSADDSLFNKDEVCDLLCDFSKHIMSLPLAERLTAEEREKIKPLHHEASLYSSNPQPDIDELPDEAYKLFYMGRLNLIEQLFGSDMFAEKGDCK